MIKEFKVKQYICDGCNDEIDVRLHDPIPTWFFGSATKVKALNTNVFFEWHACGEDCVEAAVLSALYRAEMKN